MWRRIQTSLTLRIFLLTAALLAAACALTYGALAYLTPITYTAMLEDELGAAAGELLGELEALTEAESPDVLRRFNQRTGATARVLPAGSEALAEGADSDAISSVVYSDAVDMADGDGAGEAFDQEAFAEGVAFGDALPGSGGEGSNAREGRIEISSEDDASRTDGWSFAGGVDGAQFTWTAADEAAYAGDAPAATAELRYEFAFRDGRRAELVVESGLRAVNRTAEAMRKVLPGLALALLAFSLAAALICARIITKPIVQISGLAERIAKLDFTARWKGRRRDEIGMLGQSLNKLSDGLSGALSELQAANDHLRADIERERALERARLAFFSATSHELKTPVTILKGQLSGMLAQVGAYRDREKYLARALEVTNRMEALIRQILTVSRLESGAEAGEERVDLSELLNRQLAQDAELIEARGLMLRSKVAPGVEITGNGRLLSSAVDNVLMNAILYSPPGAEICAELTPGALRVANSGARIDEKALPRLFEPFYRAEQSRNRASGGSGLGLYLVKRILEAHGAACEIKNTPEGVLFEAKFPRNQGAGAASEKPSARSESSMFASV